MNLGFHDCDCNVNSSLKELSSSWKAYPNPAQNNHVYIQSESPIKNYILYNSIGKVIIQNTNCNSIEFKLNTENLKPGVYFISIENNFGRETKPIVIE